MPNTLRLEMNKPQTIALQHATKVKGYHGPELKGMLLDGRAFYTPLSFSVKIKELGIQPGTKITVERRKDGLHVDLLSDPKIGQKAALLLEAAPDLDRPDGIPPPAPKKPMETALERALKTAVTAAAEAEKHGSVVGYPVRFKPEDIRAMAISVLIGMQERGAA